MICLTCDIHNASLDLPYNSYCEISELQVTQRLLKLLEKHSVKATVFITGKCFTEQWQDLRPICEHPLVEMGGHNYYCFEPAIIHRFWNKAVRDYCGPRWYQRHDIRKTRDIIFRTTGVSISSWRNHTLMHGPKTESILSELGIRICADEVRASATGPERHETGVYNFPVNIMPDYDHIYHASRTEEWVKQWLSQYNWSDDFGSSSYPIDQWTDLVLGQLQERLSRNTIANMLIHPMTHYICDRFVNLERILKLVGSTPNCNYRELPLAE